MKISELLARIEKEDFYKKFKAENPDSYVAAMLCILTKNEREGDKIQMDFYMPKKKKLAFSEYPFVGMQFPEEEIGEMKELSKDEMAFEVNELWEIVDKAKSQRDDPNGPKDKGTFQDTHKIIGILKDDKWMLTCLDETLGMIKIVIDALTGEVIKFEKANITDFMGFKKS